MRSLIVAFILLLTMPPLLSQQAVLQWNTEQVCGSASQDLRRPRIALNAAHEPVVLWGSTGPYTNWVAVGDGQGFSEPVRIHPEGMQPVVADWQGSGIAARSDTVYAVMKFHPENSGGTYVVRSTDGGFTWGDTMVVHTGSSPQTRFSSVAIGPEGAPQVMFMAFEAGDVDPRYVVSRMENNEFLAAVPVSADLAPGEVCDCCAGEILTQGTTTAALFRNNDDNHRAIWGAISTDGAASFSLGAELDPTGWMINACPSSGPDGYVAGDSIRTVFMSGATNGAKVYLRSANLSDMSPGPLVEVHLGQGSTMVQNFPRMAGQGDTLGVVWQQINSGQHEILFAWSTTGITGLSEPDTVNTLITGPQRTPDIAYANGTFHIVWDDSHLNTIAYRSASIVELTGIAEPENIAFTRTWPVPVSDRLHIELAEPGMSVIVHDELGRPVLAHSAMPIMDTSMLPSGTYHLTVLRKDGTTLSRGRFVVAR